MMEMMTTNDFLDYIESKNGQDARALVIRIFAHFNEQEIENYIEAVISKKERGE